MPIDEMRNMMEQEDAQEMITVLVVEPDRKPEVWTIPSGLDSLQSVVGGFIEVVYPFEDEVGLICNEEGKLDGLPLNRALYDEQGQVYDVVAGTFIVAGLTEDSFGSLTKEQIDKYSEVYAEPQAFGMLGRNIVILPTKKKSSVVEKLEEKKAEAEKKDERSEKESKRESQER